MSYTSHSMPAVSCSSRDAPNSMSEFRVGLAVKGPSLHAPVIPAQTGRHLQARCARELVLRRRRAPAARRRSTGRARSRPRRAAAAARLRRAAVEHTRGRVWHPLQGLAHSVSSRGVRPGAAAAGVPRHRVREELRCDGGRAAPGSRLRAGTRAGVMTGRCATCGAAAFHQAFQALSEMPLAKDEDTTHNPFWQSRTR